jgi:hypothetical protein
MGFMKKIWKPLAIAGASVAAPFTAGASLSALPAILGGAALSAVPSILGGLGGDALSAYGSSGKQGSTESNQTSNFTNTYGGSNETTQDPLTTLFRNNLYGQFNQEIANANKPIYGDAQKAGYLSNLNDLSKTSIDSLRRSLSKSGRLDSGALDQGLSDIETSKFGQYSGFLGQLPFMESQARSQRMLPLLQGAGAFAATAPTSSRFSGTQSGENQSAGTQNAYGPGFLKQLATNFSSRLPYSGLLPMGGVNGANKAGGELFNNLSLAGGSTKKYGANPQFGPFGNLVP